MPGWHHNNANWRPKQCVVCSADFIPRSGIHKFCSAQCKGRWKYITGSSSTENQYKEISGNWTRYVSRLLYFNGRKRDKLTRVDLLDLLEKQNYKCALSGRPLTCKLNKGTKFPTNASVDRIIPGGPYTKDNIQLVCRALNSWRADLTVDEFRDWCKSVVEHSPRGSEGQNGQA